MRKRPVQLEFTTHGGRRVGAGRKAGKRVSHHPRPAFDKVTAAHVTMRVRKDVPSLRSSRRFELIRRSFAAFRGRFGLRLVKFTVLSNHLHLIVEADDSGELSRGMQGLNIRLAKALNAALNRTGSLFDDHYHSRLLRSPTEVAYVINYVLTNAEHHYGEAGLDWFSSDAQPDVIAAPLGWLLTVGWKRGRPRAPPRDSASMSWSIA
jgi:putative transposase